MTISLAELRKIAGHYSRTLLLFTICVVLALLCQLFLVKKLYRSEAELLVSFTREVSDTRARELAANEQALIRSRDALLAVARHIAGPQTSHRDVQRLCDYLADKLTIFNAPGSDVISVGIALPNPLAARHVLGAILREYLARRAESDSPVSSGDWPADDEDDATLVMAKKALADFERDNIIFDERQVVVLNQSRENLQLALNALSNDYAYARSKLDNTRELLRALPQELLIGAPEVDNETYAALAERLEAARAERAALLRKLMPDKAAIAEQDKAIRQLEEALHSTPKTILDPDEKAGRELEARDYLNRQMLELMPEVAAQQARMDSLRSQIREIDDALLRNSEARSQLAALREAVHKASHDSGKAPGASQALPQSPQVEASTVSLIAAPSFSPDPAGPGPGLVIALACLIWAAGCLTMLRFLPRRDSSLVFPSQARDMLRLPVLAELVADGADGDKEDMPPFERYKEAFADLYDALPRGKGQALVLLFTAPEEKAADTPAFDAAAPGGDGAPLVEERGDEAARKGQSRSGPQEGKAGARRKPALFSPAEAFTAHLQTLQQKKSVFIRYMQESPALAADGPDSRQTRLGGRRGGKADTGRRPMTARPVGLTVYERSAVSIEREKSLWEKLKEDNDILVVEYAPLHRGPLLPALAEEADAAVISLWRDRNGTSEGRRCLALLRQAGAKVAGLVWIDA